MENTGGYADATQKTVYQNFTATYSHYIQLSRNVRSDEVENMMLDLMPGFRFKWWYTGAEVTSENIFKDDEINKNKKSTVKERKFVLMILASRNTYKLTVLSQSRKKGLLLL